MNHFFPESKSSGSAEEETGKDSSSDPPASDDAENAATSNISGSLALEQFPH